jgi:hypothetical protein
MDKNLLSNVSNKELIEVDNIINYGKELIEMDNLNEKELKKIETSKINLQFLQIEQNDMSSVVLKKIKTDNGW